MSRILTLQRQARELGRLRSGYTDWRRPVRSDTWIITSHAEHYVAAAAELYGGMVERWQPLGAGAPQYRVVTATNALDAILPPGDPLSQSYESWNRGGCVRRCDGMTEQMSDSPCLCRAQHGEQWHEQPKDQVCSVTTRLNVILPEMPDVGVWRAETHSFHAATEIAAHVDLVLSATGGDRAVPIRLRIEQRQRVTGGMTKKYPVIVVELRGTTAGQILSGAALAPALAGPASTAALPAAPVRLDMDSWLAAVAAARSREDLMTLRQEAARGGLAAADVDPILARRAEELGVGKAADPDELWRQILAAVPADWTTTRVEDDFAATTGVDAGEATATHMAAYLGHLRDRS